MDRESNLGVSHLRLIYQELSVCSKVQNQQSFSLEPAENQPINCQAYPKLDDCDFAISITGFWLLLLPLLCTFYSVEETEHF